jgi:hypothetical protein
MKIILFLERYAQKFDPLDKFFCILIKKFVAKLLEVWVGDPGSGKNSFRVRGSNEKSTGFRVPDPQHWLSRTIAMVLN